MTKRLLTGLIALGCTIASANALAESCEKPNFEVVNDRTVAISIDELKYFDGCKAEWNVIDVTNGDAAGSPLEIASGDEATLTPTLKHMSNCPIEKFLLHRAVRQDTGEPYVSYVWGSIRFADQGTENCNTGTTFTIHATEKE